VIVSLIVVDGSHMPANRKRVGLGYGAPVAKGVLLVAMQTLGTEVL
jgi:hypothetical protein